MNVFTPLKNCSGFTETVFSITFYSFFSIHPNFPLVQNFSISSEHE